jgi:hypothetical protein
MGNGAFHPFQRGSSDIGDGHWVFWCIHSSTCLEILSFTAPWWPVPWWASSLDPLRLHGHLTCIWSSLLSSVSHYGDISLSIYSVASISCPTVCYCLETLSFVVTCTQHVTEEEEGILVLIMFSLLYFPILTWKSKKPSVSSSAMMLMVVQGILVLVDGTSQSSSQCWDFCAVFLISRRRSCCKSWQWYVLINTWYTSICTACSCRPKV